MRKLWKPRTHLISYFSLGALHVTDMKWASSMMPWWRGGYSYIFGALGTLVPPSCATFTLSIRLQQGVVTWAQNTQRSATLPPLCHWWEFYFRNSDFGFLQDYLSVAKNSERTEHSTQRSHCVFWDCCLLTVTAVSAMVLAVTILHQNYWSSCALAPLSPVLPP